MLPVEQLEAVERGPAELLQRDRAVEVRIGGGDRLGHVEQRVARRTLRAGIQFEPLSITAWTAEFRSVAPRVGFVLRRGVAGRTRVPEARIDLDFGGDRPFVTDEFVGLDLPV